MSSYVKGETPRDLDAAKGGPKLGRTRDFLKEADAFRTDTGSGARQQYGKSNSTDDIDNDNDGDESAKGGKSLPPVKPRK